MKQETEDEKLKEDDKLKKVKKKVAGGAAAAGIGVSVLLAGLFGSPEELTQKNTESINRQEKTPVVMMMDMDLDEEDTDEDGEGEDNQTEEETGIFARVKKKILQLPAAVRALVGVPLWAVGWVIIHIASLAWEAVLGPVLGIILKWVLGALALLAVFAVAMKCAFPNLPLRKILRPKNILFILLGTVILGVADRVIPLFWNGYSGFRFVIMLAGGFVVLAAVGIPFIIKQLKKQKEEENKLLEKQEEKSITKYYIDNTLLTVKEGGRALVRIRQKTAGDRRDTD